MWNPDHGLPPLASEALAELMPELQLFWATQAFESVHSFSEYVPSLNPDQLYLGQAKYDSAPLLLDLFNGSAGPMLVNGAPGTGKTGFLRGVAGAIELSHPADDVQYAVVTDKPREWADFCSFDGSHNIGIFPTRERITFDFMLSLNTWAHGNRSDQSVVLLWDDLSLVNQLEMEHVDNFRWTLLHGPRKKVWSIVTTRTDVPSSWEYFHTLKVDCIRPGYFTLPSDGIATEGYMPPVNSYA